MLQLIMKEQIQETWGSNTIKLEWCNSAEKIGPLIMRGKRKIKLQKSTLWESAHAFKHAVLLELAKTWYFYFQPLTLEHLETPNEPDRRKFSFLFRKLYGKKNEVSSIYSAVKSTIYIFVQSYKIWKWSLRIMILASYWLFWVTDLFIKWPK